MPTRKTLLIVLLLFALASGVFAEKKSLSENSPFLPPGHGEKPPEPPKPQVQPQGPISREIEFRGIVEINGVRQFSIYNKKEQKGYWLKENELEDGISVNNYEKDASTIVVLMNGRSERLSLMTASENPMPVTKAAPSGNRQATKPALPPQLNANQSNDNSKRRNVPRRRVILPKKSN